MTMGIDAALEAVRNLGVSINDYDSEALAVMCDYVEYKIAQDSDDWEREEEYIRRAEDK